MPDSSKLEYWVIGNASDNPHRSVAVQQGTDDNPILRIYSSSERAESVIDRTDEADMNWHAAKLSRRDLIRLLEHSVEFFAVFRYCLDDDYEGTDWCRTLVAELRIANLRDELESLLPRAQQCLARCEAIRDSAEGETQEKLAQIAEVADALREAIDDTIIRNQVGFDSEEELQLILNFLGDGIRALERTVGDE